MADLPNQIVRVAIVTGGAQGIGLAIAQELGNAGVCVAIADLDTELAQSAAAGIAETTSTKSCGVGIDVSNQDSIKRGVAEITERLGAAHILVNNAGLYRSTPVLDVQPDTWRLLLDVMLTGPLLMSQALLPDMIKSQWGRIINLGSLSSVIGFGEDVAYCAAKSGITGMTRALSAELAEHQICVNSICPGNVLTKLLQDTGAAIEKRDGLAAGQFLRERAAAIPLGRLGYPEDIAHLAVFLCSEKAAYITGQSFHVNGGLYQA